MVHTTTGSPLAWLLAALTLGCASVQERAVFDELDRVGSQRRVARQRMHARTTSQPTQVERAPAAGPEPAREEPAERPTATPQAGTLTDYLRYAALNSPRLEAAFNRWRAAAERVPQATAYPDPQMTYAYYIERVETRVGPQRHRIGLRQTFPWYGTRGLRGDAALARAEAARHQFEKAKLALYYEVKRHYCELGYLARAISITEETARLVQHLEQTARSRYRVAAAEHAHVIRAQVELGKLEDEVQTLRELRAPLAAKLNALLNRPPDTVVPWPRELALEPLADGDERILAWTRDASPDLSSRRADVQQRRTQLSLARRSRYPDLTLGLDYIDTGSARTRTSDSGKDPVLATLSLNLPIWARKSRAAEREAEAELRRATFSVQDAANQLAADVKLTLYRLRDAERKITLYRDTLIPKAAESLHATEAAYRTGKTDFIGLLDSERMLLSFRLMHERAKADYAQRLAELEMLVGRHLSADAE